MADNEGRRTPLLNLGVQVSMRVLVIGTALTSMGLMITNHEVASVYGISFEAKYSYSSAFRYTYFYLILTFYHQLTSYFTNEQIKDLMIWKKKNDGSKQFVSWWNFTIIVYEKNSKDEHNKFKREISLM